MLKVLGRSGVVLLLMGGAAAACDFRAVISGTCPTAELKPSLAANGTIPKGVLRRETLWTFDSEFFDASRRRPVLLKVCGFRKPVSLNGNLTIDLRGDPALFSKNMAVVESSAVEWTKPPAGSDQKSRIQFSFRDANGAFRECGGAGSAHIKIAFNSLGVNSSRIGTQSRSALPSMSLSVAKATNIVLAQTVLHEMGHALGLGHEMMHPARLPCIRSFDPAAWVQKFHQDSGIFPFGRRAGFTDAQEFARQVDIAQNNITEILKNLSGVEVSRVKDNASIMSYPLDQVVFKNANCAMTRNNSLSPLDRDIIMANYEALQ